MQFGRLEEHELKPVTLPKLIFTSGQDDVKEAAERFITTRTIRMGRDAWQAIGKAESFSAWCKIGAALSVGKQHALRVSRANAAWGSTYSRAFSKWLIEFGFGNMRPSDRSHAIELHENLAAITAWRDGLPKRQRQRLIGTQANVKRWRKATAHGNGQCPADLQRNAMAAWRRFRACLEALPENEAADLWRTVAADIMTRPYACTCVAGE